MNYMAEPPLVLIVLPLWERAVDCDLVGKTLVSYKGEFNSSNWSGLTIVFGPVCSEVARLPKYYWLRD